MSFAEVATSDMTSTYVDMYRERQENEGVWGDEQEYKDNLHARVGGRNGAMGKPRALSFTRAFLCRVTCCQSWTRYYVYLSPSQLSKEIAAHHDFRRMTLAEPRFAGCVPW